jgi:hypothetical protein
MELQLVDDAQAALEQAAGPAPDWAKFLMGVSHFPTEPCDGPARAR